MAAVSQSRALAGSRMVMVDSRSAVKQVSNGSRYFMRRRDSYMVEVNVADTETEDQAVRRYMRAVVQSGVINKLHSRRTKETKIETYKRKLAERAQARKLGIEEPTWEEFYGENVEEAKPFDEFFCKPGDEEEEALLFAGGGLPGDLPLLDETYYQGPMYDLTGFDQQQGGAQQGGYQPGYIDGDKGGYITRGGDQDQGGYQQETFTYSAPGQQ